MREFSFFRGWRVMSEGVDWLVFFSALTLAFLGAVTMHGFLGTTDFSTRQMVWIVIGGSVTLVLSLLDLRFLRRTATITTLYTCGIAVLIFLLVIADPIQGARSWFVLGPLALQPSDPFKIILIATLAKYFSRRHVEIAHIRHIIISGVYAAIPVLLVFIQPDFGTAVILMSVWFGLVLLSGISKRHIVIVFCMGLFAVLSLWFFVFEPYQKDRILTFLNPTADIQGAGYNAYQSTVAIGSGELIGKGIGYGTQSKLRFLPEYQTDFIFAAFAEEWGFVGVLIVLSLYGIILVRLLGIASRAATNFDSLFIAGVVVLFTSHIAIHAGMNMGLLPVTGTTIPFMSYGGSHLLTEFVALGVVFSMRRHARSVHRDETKNEYFGYAS